MLSSMLTLLAITTTGYSEAGSWEPMIQADSGIRSQSKANPTLIGKLLGKDRNEIDKILGAPEKSGTYEASGSDWCQYKFTNTQGVRVTYFARGGGLPKTVSGDFDFSFEKGTTWQKAVEALGMKPAKLKPTQQQGIPSLFQLVGDPFKNWNVYFAGPNAHYPGGTSLINVNEGLPLIKFELRSINDSSPDYKS